MSDTSKDLVRRHFEEIWNERKLDACDELMAEDFTENAAAPFAPSRSGPGPRSLGDARHGWVARLTVPGHPHGHRVDHRGA